MFLSRILIVIITAQICKPCLIQERTKVIIRRLVFFDEPPVRAECRSYKSERELRKIVVVNPCIIREPGRTETHLQRVNFPGGRYIKRVCYVYQSESQSVLLLSHES